MRPSSSNPSEPAVRVLYWFRTDLRLHSSPALHAALALQPEVIFPVWTWDPNYVFAHRVGVNRFGFLLECMQDLSASLTALNPNTKLLVVRGAPQTVLPRLFQEWRISHIVYEIDRAGYGARRDLQVSALASQAGIKVISVVGNTLYDLKEVVELNGGKATLSLASWHAAVKKCPQPARPLPAPTTFPPLGDTSFSQAYPSLDVPIDYSTDLNNGIRNREVTCFDTFSGPKGDFGVPAIDELGLSRPTTSIRGGESEALRRLAVFCADKDRVAHFSKPQTSPAEFDPPETTLLSPFLKFGCLSVHEFFWRVRDTVASWEGGGPGKKPATKEPENLQGQLHFREMYNAAEYAEGIHFGRIYKNSVCRFIDWDLRDEFGQDGAKIIPRPLGDPRAEEWFLAWKEGRTGFPWIDAIMRQLRQEGWIHHLARHSVACFLTRGQCYISWERGAEVFDEYLLDWDPCANPGNWMWLSASAFYHMYYRVYGVQSFPKKYDKTGKLVRKFCPELSKFPDQFIYAPHLAPLEVQLSAGCVIGQDYPMPMLDDVAEKKRCMTRLKVAYALGLYGSDGAVLDGTADSLLKEGYRQALAGIKSDKKQGQKKSRTVSGGDGPSPSNLTTDVKTMATKELKHGSGSIEGFLTKKRKRD
ncbi:FAD binding domain of DNA photolyase-domain-containing protein [Collybia nuda]|uniref:FAD binding domain of DNA photolyase-domain-containing protein n=1 Tax=Collybia nuda TaxID=64659 RepID=A0A9P6CGA4_9AGAR|nr:FAD binding domain of DNA photolyase-domain-containing protein [Collybia nuda]